VTLIIKVPVYFIRPTGSAGKRRNFSNIAGGIMAFIKKLAGETILYGMSNILPRILNYLVITYYLTRKFPENIYAKHGTYYAFTAFILVIFSFRMETAFFRFGNQKQQRESAFGTALIIVAGISVLLSALIFGFARPLADILSANPDEYYIVQWFVANLA